MIYVILIFGFILRLISLNQSFWLDEAVQVWAGGHFSVKTLFSQYLPGDFNPPLYHFLLHFWMKVTGNTEIAVRLPSVIFGLLTIWLIFKIAKQLRIPTILSAIFLATSPLHIYYSQEARMYSLACLAVVWVFWRFLLWKEKSNFRNSFWFSLSLVLTGFSHYLTFLVLPIFWLFTKRQNYWKLLLIHLPLLLLFGLYLPMFSRQLESGITWRLAYPIWGKTVGSFTLKAAALLPVKFIIGRITIDNEIVYGLVAVLLVIFYWGLVFLGCRPKDKKNNFLLLFFLFLPTTAGFLISFFVPVFSYFRFLFCLPFFYLLIVCGIASIRNRRIRTGIIIILLIINLICSLVYLFNSRFHREDWRGMAAWLRQQPTASVLILSQISMPFEHYNLRSNEVLYWPTDKEKLAKNDKIWLVEYGLPIFDPQDQLKTNLRSLGFLLIKEKTFRGINKISFWEKTKYAHCN